MVVHNFKTGPFFYFVGLVYTIYSIYIPILNIMSDKSKKKGQQVRAEEEPGLGRTQKPASQPPIGRLSSAPAVLETPPMSRSNSLAEPMQKLRLAVFDHLVKKTNTLDPLSIEQGTTGIFIHPAIIKLGLLFRKGVVREDDDRVGALLYAFVSVIEDYTTPSNTQLSRDLDKHVRNQVQYLVDARQHSVGMGNAIKFLRHSITQISPDTSEAQAKSFLVNALSTFANERIVLARTSIVNHCEKVIRNNDVILTFGSSVVVRNVLIELTKKKKSLTLHVIIVDTRPLNDGIETLQALTENNIRCSYTPLAGAAAAMRTVSRVLLGASALLANGTMVAPAGKLIHILLLICTLAMYNCVIYAGTAMIASLAKLNRIPVIVAAETYKFSERVQVLFPSYYY